MDEDIGDRFANAVKFALDGSRTPRVVEPSAATSELGRVPGYYQGVEPAIRMARDVRTNGTVPNLRQPAP